MENGIRIETIRRGQDYYGKIAIYEARKRLYTVQSSIRRLSRGDARIDASRMAHDLKVEQFITEK